MFRELRTPFNTVTVFGRHDKGTLQQILRCATDERVFGAALLADGHKGYSMPIGGVVAHRGVVSPSGVGYDIGCGVMGVKTNIHRDDIAGSVDVLADVIYQNVSFGIGQMSGIGRDHSLFDDDLWSEPELWGMKQQAREQLGTVGSGNHYVNVMVDQEDQFIWITAHFGSRGFGHKVASGFLNLAKGLKFTEKIHDGEMDQDPAILRLDQDVGQFYMKAMELAGRYAYAGRSLVVGQVLDILGGQAVDTVHNHHNYAWEETHGGEQVIVVRKGATPAFPGQRGVIGGSMGDVTVIVEGVESSGSADSLYSTVHGAGRVMSRRAAKGKDTPIVGPDGVNFIYSLKTKKAIRTRTGGLITREMQREWIQREGVTVRGGDVDESPHAYRRLPKVLAAQGDTIKICHTLKPLIVCMASPSEHDPYKD